jgi:hypothetical protein
MTSSALRIGVLAGLLATTACGVKSRTTDVSPGMARNPTCENAIVVFDSRADVPSSYYELAWIEVEGNSVWTTDRQMTDKMKKRAAEVGANGLIANPVQQNKTGVNVLGEAIGARSATARASGLAIWIPGASDRTMLACGTR